MISTILRFAPVIAVLAVPPSAHAVTYKLEYAFRGGHDGINPEAPLLHAGGTLYGTTAAGGSGTGTIFTLQTASRTERVFYASKGGKDAQRFSTGLLPLQGNFYGVTDAGGADASGAVFRLAPATGIETVIYSFKSGTDSAFPKAPLVNVAGMLYGTSSNDGPAGNGTVFKINPATGAETIVYAFKGGTDGAQPDAALLDLNGTLYGTTFQGGPSNNGVVFKVDPATGAEKVVYAFGAAPDGAGPLAALISADGALYGTTYGGGKYFAGTVFRVDPVTGAERVLHAFGGRNDGSLPAAPLLNIRGTLFGTTYEGGKGNFGTVYKLAAATGVESIVHDFTGGTDGAYPLAALINAGGVPFYALYGTTYAGGSRGCFGGCGTVFSIRP